MKLIGEFEHECETRDVHDSKTTWENTLNCRKQARAKEKKKILAQKKQNDISIINLKIKNHLKLTVATKTNIKTKAHKLSLTVTLTVTITLGNVTFLQDLLKILLTIMIKYSKKFYSPP
ncbi:hypothetical protein BpHYR1_026659 [Brachionus plicatilis]|uniref:Uncharacterized protein n=1 Tax=Brachionus plicatilis TaxID=10195 RepID=A0A3M7QG97_BRAPC|nr:hypothetical protein BpHYR1_026659 [Brachionus plicatilis]